jgi:hypothetical protein
MTLKAQNLEIGKDVINEIARYATAFAAGLLPVHTYYVGSGSWLLPAIKARLTDVARNGIIGNMIIPQHRDKKSSNRTHSRLALR